MLPDAVSAAIKRLIGCLFHVMFVEVVLGGVKSLQMHLG